jgi:hypothetical protein
MRPSISGLQQRVESEIMEALPLMQRSDLQVRLEKRADRAKSLLQGGRPHALQPYGQVQGKHYCERQSSKRRLSLRRGQIWRGIQNPASRAHETPDI